MRDASKRDRKESKHVVKECRVMAEKESGQD